MRRFLKSLIAKRFSSLPSYSRLVLAADNPNWSIANDMNEVSKIVRLLGGKVTPKIFLSMIDHQCLFFGSHFDLFLEKGCDRWFETTNRLATAYFHGRPGDGVDEFDICFARLKENHQRISRIQVSYSEMKDVILESGIDPGKVFQIPIGINLDYFSLQTMESRRKVREKLGIPQSAAVIGSFQKDGQGWGDGMEPKLIKGPDVFLKTVEILKDSVPEIFVLLSGPARGYIKAGLERLKIPYRHVYQKSYPEIGTMFQALDLYIIASREEGGPKAVLESMASGVPLVTTRVGQAMDLVEHGRNGWMVGPGDAEGLAFWADAALQNRDKCKAVTMAGYKTAEANSYSSQISLWKEFMNGFLDIKRR